MGNNKEEVSYDIQGTKKALYRRERNLYSEIFWTNVERIVESRKDITWADISQYLGTDRTTIASMRSRRSRLSLDTVLHISDILCVPVEHLLTVNGPIPHKMDHMYMSETEYMLLMDCRAIGNRKRIDAVMNILFTVLREFKNLP